MKSKAKHIQVSSTKNRAVLRGGASKLALLALIVMLAGAVLLSVGGARYNKAYADSSQTCDGPVTDYSDANPPKELDAGYKETNTNYSRVKSDGTPVGSTSSADGGIPGLWKGGLAKSIIIEDGQSRNGGGSTTSVGNSAPWDSDPNSYVSPLPAGTITINVGALSGASQFYIYDDSFAFAANTAGNKAKLKRGNLISGLQRYEDGATFDSTDPSIVTSNPSDVKAEVVYVAGIQGSMEGVNEEGSNYVRTIEGTGGNPVIRIVYPGVAQAQDGSRHDLIVSFTKIVLQTNFESGPFNSTNPAAGGRPIGNITATALNEDMRYVYKDGGDTKRWFTGTEKTGWEYDFDIEVGSYDAASGTVMPISEGTILYSVNDLDVANVFDNSSTAWREAMTIESGAKSDAFVPADNILNFEEIDGRSGSTGANGLRFTPRTTQYNDRNTFDSGFAVLIDAAKTKMRWTGSGSANMGTTIWNDSIYYRIDQTQENGEIWTTTGSEGCERELHQTPVNVSNGGSQTYYFKPKDGYGEGTVEIDGHNKIYLDDILPAGTPTATVNIGGTDYEFTKDPTTGIVSVTFEKVHANHKIHVAYKKIDSYRYVQKQWIGGTEDDQESITLVAQAYRHVPVVEVSTNQGTNYQFFPWWYGGSALSTGGLQVKRVDPNGDGVTVMKRQKYYPSTMDFAGFVSMTRNDADGRRASTDAVGAYERKEASALQYSWDGNFYVAIGWDGTKVTGGYENIKAWSGAELGTEAASVVSYYHANATGMEYQRSGANRAIIQGGIVDESSSIWIQPHTKSGARDSWQSGVGYNPTAQAAILLPYDGYRAVPGSSEYTVQVTVPKNAVEASGDTWTIKWPKAGGTEGGVEWPALPDHDANGSELYWFVTEQAPELDGSSELKSDYKWELTRYQNKGSLAIHEVYNDANIGTYAYGGEIAATENPYILGGGTYKNTQPGFTSRAYLGDSLDNAGLIVNDRVTDFTAIKKWVDKNSDSHSAGELMAKIKIYAVYEDGSSKDVTNNYIAGGASKSYSARSQLAVDGEQYKVKEIPYVEITPDGNAKEYTIKLNHLPTYDLGDNANTNDGASENSKTNEINGSRNNFGIEEEGSAIHNGVNSTVDVAQAKKIVRYYLVEDQVDGYLTTYDNTSAADSALQTDKDKAHDEGMIKNVKPDPLVSKDGQFNSSGGNTKTQTVDAKSAFKKSGIEVSTIKLKDPSTGEEKDSVTVPGEGTYAVDPTTGEITFTPEDGFSGKAGGVTVIGTEKNSNTKAETTYTPIVVPNKQTQTVERTIEYRYTDTDGNEVVEKVVQTATIERIGDYDPDKDDHPTEYGTMSDPTDANTLDFTGTSNAWNPASLKAVTSPTDSGGWAPDQETVDAITGVTPDNAASKGFTQTTDPTTGAVTWKKTETVIYTPQAPKGKTDETWGFPGNDQETDATSLFSVTTSKTAADDDGNRENNTITKDSIKLINPDTGEETNGPVDAYATVDGQRIKVGTYTYDPTTGKITFHPNDDFKAGADPEPVEVKGTDKNGRSATAKYQPHFVPDKDEVTIKRKIDYKYDDGAPVLDNEGKPIVVEQEITFTRTATSIDPDTHQPVWGDWQPDSAEMPEVTSPDADREGYGPGQLKVDAVSGLSHDDVDNPGETTKKEAKYPDVTIIYTKPPTAEEKKTYGGKGETQKGTPPFTEGSKPFTSFTLIDPETGDSVGEITIPGEGTYTIDKTTGEVTFVPEPDFVGTATKVTVRGTDENDHTADGYYTPTVVDNTETKTVKRTIEYKYDDGTPVMEDDPDNPGKQRPKVVVEEKTFTRTAKVDSDTGTLTWEDWKPQSYNDVPSDKITGYTPDKATVSAHKTTPDDGDENVVVVYSKTKYTVTYEDGDHGKSSGGSKKKEYGDTPQDNTTKASKGYVFTGSFSYVITDEDGNVIDSGTTDDPKSIEVIGNIVFTPVYKKLPTVTYIDPATGRTIQKTLSFLDEETEPNPPANPERKGYTFVGWDREVDAEGNVVYKAKWEKVSQPATRTKPAPRAAVPNTGDTSMSIGLLTGVLLVLAGKKLELLFARK